MKFASVVFIASVVVVVIAFVGHFCCDGPFFRTVASFASCFFSLFFPVVDVFYFVGVAAAGSFLRAAVKLFVVCDFCRLLLCGCVVAPPFGLAFARRPLRSRSARELFFAAACVV